MPTICAKTAETRTRRRRATALSVEGLESRLVLNGTTSAGVLGTISGHVLNQATGQGVRHVAVELINANGRVVKIARTDPSGSYQFDVKQDGPYVVHELTPRRFNQVTPTFYNTAPTGSYTPGAGSNSWNYTSTNTNPANGPVGPFAWDTIAPAGNLPYQSPINLHGPTVDLSRVLTVNYRNAVPSAIINNSHQIQAQFPSTAADTISVAGQSYNLAQFHYHDPSEITVRGHVYNLEEHFVNVSASGAESVVTVFLKVGAHNNSLDPVLNAASTGLTMPNSKTTIAGPINFAGLLPRSTRGWYYEGSLTTPPLSQPVNWFVYAMPVTLDAAQLAQYESVARGSGFLPNARPLQPPDGRQLNQLNNQVNFQGTSVANADFTLTPR